MMGRSLALAIALVACGGASDVRATTTPARSATPVATTLTPRPSPTAVAIPSPVVSADAGGPRGAQPPGTLHYVAIGASDSVGVGSLDPANGSWPSRVAALLPLGSTYRNLGVSGSLTAQAQRDQLPVALREQPTVVTVWLAVNDINAQVTPQSYSASLAAIVDALLQGTGARIFVGNVPDLRAVPAYAAVDPLVLLATVQAYNTAVASVAAKNSVRVTVVDLFSGSADLVTQLTVAADGFHPSDAGYALIAQRFADAMRRSGIPLRST